MKIKKQIKLKNKLSKNELTIINESKNKIPIRFIKTWLNSLLESHLKSHRKEIANKNIVIVFMNQAKAKKINFQFRQKSYATDILSFKGEYDDLGELIICFDVIKKQAKEHGLSLKEELGYMLIHGVLHLLGYEHELDAKSAKKMFSKQDNIFKKMCVEFL